jgi:pilus assembly protein CpaB
MTSENTAARPAGGGGSNRQVLLVGLALGVVTALLIAVVLTRGDDGGGGDQTTTRTGPTTRVAVVAKQDIPANTRLTRELLEVKTFNISEVDSDAFTSVSQVLNRVTATDVKAGSAVVPALVSTTVGEGLTFAVSPGMRAISVSVSEVVIAGGNLSAGNRVDILGVVDVGAGRTIPAGDVSAFISQMTGVPATGPVNVPEGSRLTFTLLQDVRVLAVAQTLPPDTKAPASSTTQDDKTFADTAKAAAPNPKAGTVTLEVTPQQAQIMVTADLTATLRLAVRAFGDPTPGQTAPIIIRINNQ